MKALLESRTWVGILAAAALIAVSLATYYFTRHGGGGSQAMNLPPIQHVDVPPGFVGDQAFGLWRLSCRNGSAQGASAVKHFCRTNARMIVAGPNNTPVLAAGFNVVMASNHDGPAILFVLPLAARVAKTANFAIDKNPAFEAPIACTDKQCVVQGALPAEAIEQLRSGKTLSLVYTVKDREQKDRKVRIDQLLHGFRQSYDAMAHAMTA